MHLDILSLFPGYFGSPLQESIIGRAIRAGLLSVKQVDIRDFSCNKHRRVDDRPYGGGPGMVLEPGPVVAAVRSVKRPDSTVIYLTPQGRKLDAAVARELSHSSHLVLICGHYEGIDQRAIDLCVDREISVGDYVLTSGCPAALVLLDAVVRFIPGVLGDEQSAEQDSFEQGMLDFPQYTRPEVFEGLAVPPVLVGGDHKKIASWRESSALARTVERRPDLFSGREL